MRRHVILLLLAALIANTAACSRIPPESGTAADSSGPPDPGTTAEESEPEETMPFPFELSGSAAYENGTVLSRAPHGNANTASFDPGRDEYRLSFLLTPSPGLTGALYFCANGTDHGYRLSVNAKKQKAILSVIRKGDLDQISYTSVRAESGQPLRVTVDVGNGEVRISFGDACDDPDSMRFDLLRRDDEGGLVILDCGSSGDASFSDISVSDPPGPPSGRTYLNPILGTDTESADPFILCDGGRYYVYSTNAPSRGYKVSVSDDLLTWEDLGFCLKNEDVFGEPTSTAGFWAPEVYAVERDGKKVFILLYTVGEHVGIAFSDSPAGPFRSEKDSYLITDSNAIDPTIFTDDDGKSYLFYVGFGSVQYGIWGRTVDLGTLALGQPKLIISPKSGSWETAEGSVTEGPFVLKHDGTYYLTYSGNGYTSRKYAIGYATSDSPLGKYERFDGNPILSQNPQNGVWGPGHHAFFTTPGGRLMIVYHRHQSFKSVWPRVACIDRVAFVDVRDGPDRLIIPGPTVTRQTMPD